jgi:hypothetical protein
VLKAIGVDDDLAHGRVLNAQLSRMLFEARERVEMLADIVEGRTGKPAEYERGLVREIDAYRAARGWNPHGYGDET